MPLVLRLAKLSRRLATIRTLTASVLLAAACSDATGPAAPRAELPLDPGVSPSALPATTGAGDRVRVRSTAYVRSAPNLSSPLLGKQPVGALGVVTGAGVRDDAGDGNVRYPVNFDAGVDGWTAAGYLELTAATPVTRVVVSPRTASLAVGATRTITATATDASGAIVQGATVSWRSKDSTKVRVSSAGVVTAIAAGTVWVLANSGTPKDSAAITVTTASTTTPIVHVGRYVATNGVSTNDGTITRPWPLATALAGAGGRIVAGDTVWVRGGTYRGAFTSTLTGTSGRTIVVRAYPGERATLENDGSGGTTLQVRGAWSVFWGFEVRDQNTVRYSSELGNGGRPHGLVNNASNTKYINMIVHDAGVAFYNYPETNNVEVVGAIMYNNGWQAPDRGHGHALYVKSNTGPVLLKDNVLFNQYGYGVHVYSNAGSGRLNNIRVEGNTAFNNGSLSNNSDSENILVGGADISTGSAVVNNLAYFSAGEGGRNMRIGYSTTANGTVTVTDNQVIGGSPVLDFGRWSSATVRNNTFIGNGQIVRANFAVSGTWSGNTHRRDPAATAWFSGGSWRTFSAWRSATGLGGSDVVSGTPASGQRILVRASPYESGRATISVVDHAASGSVTVPLSGVLAIGDRYEVRSVQALFGAPLVSGTFGGSLVLPMGAVSPPVPVGGTASQAPRTGAGFDVFLVTRVP